MELSFQSGQYYRQFQHCREWWYFRMSSPYSVEYSIHRLHLNYFKNCTWSEIILFFVWSWRSLIHLSFLSLGVPHSQQIILIWTLTGKWNESKLYFNRLNLSNGVDHHAPRTFGSEWEIDGDCTNNEYGHYDKFVNFVIHW